MALRLFGAPGKFAEKLKDDELAKEKGAEYLGDGHGVVTVGPFPRGTSGGCS